MRPLSVKMEEILMESHERAILNLEPLSTYYSKYCKGLLQRGYLTVKSFNRDDKTLMAFFITDEGVKYLDETKRLIKGQDSLSSIAHD